MQIIYKNKVLAIGSVRNSPGKVICPGGKQVEKVACPP